MHEGSKSKKEDIERRRADIQKALDEVQKDADSEMPVTCSRCLYDIVMANEGKQRAQRFIKVAGSVEVSRKALKSV